MTNKKLDAKPANFQSGDYDSPDNMRTFLAMKKPFFLLFAIVTFVQVGRAQNLFLNSGFETATTAMPTGTPIPAYPTTLNSWTAVTVDGEFIRDPLYAHTGNGYLSVLQNAGANSITPWLGASGGGGYDRVAQVVPVAGSTQYQLGVWYRAGNGDRYGYGAGDFVIQVEQLAPTNATITFQVLPATLNWQYTTLNFTTGASASSIIVMFACSGVNNVDVWVDDVELRLPCSLSVDLGNDTTLCPGNNLLLDATTASATGYLWQDGSSNSTFNVTAAGTYWVQVDSAGICSARDTIVVTDSVCCPTLSFTYTVSVTTSGLNTGAVKAIVTGGQAPYTYSLDNSTFQSSNIFTNLPLGTYQLYAIDSNGCTGQGTFIIDRAGCCAGQ